MHYGQVIFFDAVDFIPVSDEAHSLLDFCCNIMWNQDFKSTNKWK